MHQIDGKNLKRTYCDTREILASVLEDYESRGFTELEVWTGEDDPSRVLHIDFGGSLLSTEKPVRVGRLSFFPHQLHSVICALGESKDRGGYVKLHGQYYCLCISPELAKQLLELMRGESAAIERLAESQFAEWKNRYGKGRV